MLNLNTPMSSAGNHSQAQRYANAAWGWGALCVGCLLLWNWASASIPALFVVGSVWESFKATKRALQWEKIEAIRSQSTSEAEAD